jgi:hypothetical protein
VVTTFDAFFTAAHMKWKSERRPIQRNGAIRSLASFRHADRREDFLPYHRHRIVLAQRRPGLRGVWRRRHAG